MLAEAETKDTDVPYLECDLSWAPRGNFVKLGRNIHLESKMKWFEFGGESLLWHYIHLHFEAL